MKREINDFRSEGLKEKVSLLLAKSKKMKIIKSHVQAFEDVPIEKEQHKGNVKGYSAIRK